MKRSFADLESFVRELTPSQNGTLYFLNTPKVPLFLLRHFDGALPPEMTAPYADIHEAAADWLETVPDLAALLVLQRPAEVGVDFVIREFRHETSLARFLEDREIDCPGDLDLLEVELQLAASAAQTAREQFLYRLLAESVHQGAEKVVWSGQKDRFVIAELRLSRSDLEEWAVR